jgi:hypothetical protein
MYKSDHQGIRSGILASGGIDQVCGLKTVQADSMWDRIFKTPFTKKGCWVGQG